MMSPTAFAFGFRDSNYGIALIHVLVIVSLASAFSLIYANSNKSFNEERMAALTIARASALLDRIHFERDGSVDSSGWTGECGNRDLLANSVNGFGYFFGVHASTCSERFLTFYYYVPSRWSDYIRNHLEATEEVALPPAIINQIFPEYNDLNISDLALLSTTIDVYGNLTKGSRFVRKSFETINTSRGSNVTSGVTRAVIQKPECSVGEPQIYYSVSGVCSYYPLMGDPYELESLIVRSDNDFGYDDYYKTWGIEYRLEEDCSASNCPWRIELYTNERWGNAVPDSTSTSPNPPMVRGSPRTLEGQSPSIDECVNGGGDNIDEDSTIAELLEYQGRFYWPSGRYQLTQFLDQYGLYNHVLFANFIDPLEINGEDYGRDELLDMSIEDFEDEFGVTVEGVSISAKLTVDAWVSCSE